MRFFKGTIFLATLLTLLSCETEVNITPNDSGTFVKFYGGDSDDIGYDAIETTNGNFAIVGSTESFGNGGSDVFFLLADGNGNPITDSITFGGPGNDLGRSIIEKTDGDFLIVGDFTDTSTIIPNRRILLLEVSSQGTIGDTVTFGSDLLDDRGFSVASTQDGGYILSGSRQPILGLGDTDSYILKLDANYAIEWENDDALLGLADDTGNSVIETLNGDFIYSSTSQRESEQDFTDMRLTSLNTLGQINWNFFFGENGQNETASSIYGSDQNIFSVGTTNPGELNSDIFLIRTTLGGFGQTITLDLGGQDEGKDVTELSDGNIAVLVENEGNIVVTKIDAFGNELWDNRPRIGSEDSDIAASIFECSDRGIAVIGTITFAGNSMIIFAKFNKDGELEK